MRLCGAAGTGAVAGLAGWTAVVAETWLLIPERLPTASPASTV